MAGKKRVTSLLDLTTPEGEGEFDYPTSSGFERRLPRLPQPLHQGGGDLSSIGPQTYAPTGVDQYAPPSGMSLPNVGLGYTMPLAGGELTVQGMRRPLDMPANPGGLRQQPYGGMFNWRREF